MKKQAWSPYLAGALSGVLAVASVGIAGKYLGASTSFVRTAGMAEKLVSREHVEKTEYFAEEGSSVDWQWMFVVGIAIGSFAAARMSGTFQWKAVPDSWERRFGPSRVKRGAVAFVGGVIAIFGARPAGGCPSGHGLSGTMQLAVSGFTALACFFIGGLAVARLLYGGGKSR